MKDEFILDVLTSVPNGALTNAAIAFRRDPKWLTVPKDQKLRGLVVAYNAHDDDYGYQYGDTASGEIEWR
jgi:hypothetical protein